MAVTDVLRYWGLREGPFETTFDPRFFYASESHEEALARLELLAEDGDMGFGLLTGEVGSGKTFASALFAGALDRRRFAPMFLPAAPAGPASGYACVLHEITCALRGEAPAGGPAGAYELLVEFRRLLGPRIAMRGLHLVLILDEAQELSERDLVGLRGLLNSASAGRSLMTIVLVGQPGLRDRLRALPTVETRVGLKYHLRPMREEETATYVLHRLHAAGDTAGRTLSADAAAVLAERAGGIPREINRIGKLALYAGAARGAESVGPDDIVSVAEDPVGNCT